MRILWLEAARDDLAEIWTFIAQDNPAAADRVFSRIAEAASALAVTPDMGRIGRVPGTRELVISGLPYIIVYSHKPEVVEILGVMHGARRWPAV